MEQNPMLWILNADPGKYIRKPSATIVAFMKLIEGLFTFLVAVGLIEFFNEFVISGKFRNVIKIDLFSSLPIDQVLNMIPSELMGQMGQSAQPDLSALQQIMSFLTIDVYTGTLIEQITLVAAILGMIVIMLGIAVEGVFLIVLRFSMKGSKVLKLTQRFIIFANISLLADAVGFFAFRIYNCVTSGSFTIAIVLAPAAPIITLLIFSLLYARTVYAVFFSIEYEIRLEFKDTDANKIRLRKYSLLFSFMLLLATVVLIILSLNKTVEFETVSLLVIGCGFMAIKYYAVSRAFWNFLWCHKHRVKCL